MAVAPRRAPPHGPVMDRWKEGELALLWGSARDQVLLVLQRGSQSVEGRGVLDLSGQIGELPGTTVDWAGRKYRLLRPALGDLLGSLQRRAQVVTAKDAARLIQLAGVGPGSRVAEAGSGSGWLTVALAFAVGPSGHVYSHDRRPEFLEFAKANVRRVQLGERVEFVEADVAERGFAARDLDAVILDLPEPWTGLSAASESLAPGGRLAAYTPTYNQLEHTVRSLREAGFEGAQAEELLLRPIEVGEGGTRPSFEMLGHTGFLLVARWMGPPW
ncbi:MAG: tRNA (adenine-N1)-methyltransferase [Thermoplasmata archaeon]|nr:tRNA (adenine-N1)-methyltransferase [Thermoplasmata archaeon]MCI4338398.1 tRNA (adenine-N1)-methyltransferase [Thermoplasmata archaeon]MCI4340816.1 tRNA (adenine-N1)-methyltransferase [Thermoplasmata archaeon]